MAWLRHALRPYLDGHMVSAAGSGDACGSCRQAWHGSALRLAQPTMRALTWEDLFHEPAVPLNTARKAQGGTSSE